MAWLSGSKPNIYEVSGSTRHARQTIWKLGCEGAKSWFSISASADVPSGWVQTLEMFYAWKYFIPIRFRAIFPERYLSFFTELVPLEKA